MRLDSIRNDCCTKERRSPSAQHADLLEPFDHGSRADHTQTGDANDESERQESSYEVQEREGAAELLTQLVGDDHRLPRERSSS